LEFGKFPPGNETKITELLVGMKSELLLALVILRVGCYLRQKPNAEPRCEVRSAVLIKLQEFPFRFFLGLARVDGVFKSGVRRHLSRILGDPRSGLGRLGLFFATRLFLPPNHVEFLRRFKLAADTKVPFLSANSARAAIIRLGFFSSKSKL
jgi:hypothetical protein